jgi:hypothetical protein
MNGPSPREVLGVVDVMARYGLRDRRAARRLMDEAGAFIVCGRLVLRREDLLAHEEVLRSARRPLSLPAVAPARSVSAGKTTARSRPEPLRPGWWRSAPRDDRDAA